MSNVLKRNRQISQIEYLNSAINIRTEITKMVMREQVIPKRYRYVYSIPIIDKCRELVNNAYAYHTYVQYDDGTESIYIKKREALMAMITACDNISHELLAAKRQLNNIRIGPYERVVALIVDEKGLIGRELEYITKKHKVS